MQAAASIISLLIITEPSCNGEPGLNIESNKGAVTSAFNSVPASLYDRRPVSL